MLESLNFMIPIIDRDQDRISKIETVNIQLLLIKESLKILLLYLYKALHLLQKRKWADLSDSGTIAIQWEKKAVDFYDLLRLTMPEIEITSPTTQFYQDNQMTHIFH